MNKITHGFFSFALMITLSVLLLASCSQGTSGDDEEDLVWTDVTTLAQITGTWSGTFTTTEIDEEDGTESTYSITRTMTYPVESKVRNVDVFSLAAVMEDLPADQVAAYWAAISEVIIEEYSTGTDESEGITTTVTATTGSPYTITMTSLISEAYATEMLSDISIDSTGKYVQMIEEDEDDAGVVTTTTITLKKK